MNVPLSLKLQLQSDPAILPEVRAKLQEFGQQHGWGQACTADIVLAVDEALTNVIRHGYEGQTGRPIDLHVNVTSAGHGCCIEVRLRDYGKQVDPDSIRGRDLDDVRPGGLGVHIIQRVMDSAEYSCPDDGGMQLVMRKFTSPGNNDNPSSPAESV